MSGALDGLRVVEVGEFISAPYATKLLADLGAEVVKVEPPHGDRARRYGPFRNDVPDPEGSGLFAYLNTNKRGITLDLHVPAAREALGRLLDRADVLVEGVEPGDVAPFGLEYAMLHAAHPGLIVTSISPFGRSGPRAHYRGHGIQESAAAVVAYRTGSPDRYPLCKPLNDAEFFGGVHGAAGALLAALFRDRTGRAQHVDVSVQDAMATTISSNSIVSMLAGTRMMATRTGHRATAYYPWTVLPVQDGHMEFITMQQRHWEAMLDEFGNPEWGNDPRFANMWERVQFADELDELIRPHVEGRTKADLWQAFRERRISYQPVHTVQEVVESDHMAARQYYVDIQDGDGRPMRVPGAPYRPSATPWAIRTKAPRLGEHTATMLAELGYSAEEQVDLFRAGAI